MAGELDFENELIHHLERIGGSKQWKYEPSIKTIPALWANFRAILERNNADKLGGRPLTDTEFTQVKAVICGLRSPYEAGCWLYGLNGVTQIEVDRDEAEDGTGGNHIFLTCSIRLRLALETRCIRSSIKSRDRMLWRDVKIADSIRHC